MAAFQGKAAILQDRNFFYFGLILQAGPHADQEKMILSFLKNAGLDVEYPIKPAARVYPFTKNYCIVQGFPDVDTTVRIKGTRYQPVGMKVLDPPRIRDGFIELTVPKSAMALIRVW